MKVGDDFDEPVLLGRVRTDAHGNYRFAHRFDLANHQYRMFATVGPTRQTLGNTSSDVVVTS